MIEVENIISNLIKFNDCNEEIIEVFKRIQTSDVDGIIFLKPELTSIPSEKLRLALTYFQLLLKKYQIEIQSAYIISGPFLLDKNIFAQNYKHIRQYACYDLTPNEISHVKLAVMMRGHKDCQAVLGGITLVQRGFSPQFVLDIWSNSGKVIKIDDNLYGVLCVLRGEKILLINGFYPAQCNQYNSPKSKIIFLAFSTTTSFAVLKKYFQGSAEADGRYSLSMRQHLYGKRQEYQLDSFSPSLNGIHISNSREEGKREAKLFLEAIDNYFRKGAG